MKQETINPTYDQLKRYEDEARLLRSQEIFRLSRVFFKLPLRLVKRSVATKISADSTATQNP